MRKYLLLMMAGLLTAAAGAAEQNNQEKAIAADLAAVNAKLAELGGREVFLQRMQPLYDENRQAAKEQRAGWFGDAYYVAGVVAPPAGFGDFFEGIVSLRDYLARENVELIVVRVPSRHEVAFPYFVSSSVEPGVLVYAFLELRKQLLEAGVEYIDGLEAMHRRSGEYPLSYWYMLPREGHPAEGLSRILAEVIAARLERYSLPRTGDYRMVEVSDLYRQEKYPAGNPKFDPNARITAAGVVDRTGAVPEIGEVHTSPMLFVSDSFGAYPGVKAGGSIPHYVAQLTGHLPDWLYRSGSSGGSPTFLYRKGVDFVRGRRVVVAICHPGNLFGKYSRVPPAELQHLPAERLTELERFSAANWTALAAEPRIGEGGKSFAVQPDGTLLLHPLQADATGGPGGGMTLALRPEWRQKYLAFAVRLTFKYHTYLTVTASGGGTSHCEYLSVSEPVKTLLLPVKTTGGEVRLTFDSVSVRGGKSTALESVELLGVK